MIIVSVDPGISTGIAKHCIESNSSWILTLPLAQAYEFVKNDAYNILVVETMPTHETNPDQYLKSFYYEFLSLPNAKKVSPGNWKPLAKAQEWKCAGNTPHEIDAWNILRFWCLVTYRQDIGEF